jgi:DNA-binding XRE family transcriptional regulator
MDNFQISLAAARVNADKTQEDISNFMHVSKNTVVNWEKGTTEPTISQARKLAAYLNMPLDRIIFMPSETN